MLTKTHRERFDNDGFVRIEGLLDPANQLEPLLGQYDSHLDALARDLAQNNDLSESLPASNFADRVGQLYRLADRETFENHFNISIPLSGVTETSTFFNGTALFDLMKSEPILDIVEAVLGSEISSSPIQHARLKPPEKFIDPSMKSSGLLAATPWHQDAAVVPPESGIELVTVWIPLVDVTRESGCLQFIRGGHKAGLRNHGYGEVDGLTVCSLDLRQEPVVEMPARRGDVILIHRHCPHSSLPNRSDCVRMSIDLRYHPSHQPSGREALPGFVVRSRTNPGAVIQNAQAWQRCWENARLRLIDNDVTDAYHWISPD